MSDKISPIAHMLLFIAHMLAAIPQILLNVMRRINNLLK
jgi:hypothetical protein